MACLMSRENKAQDTQCTGNCGDLEIIEFNVLYNLIFFS